VETYCWLALLANGQVRRPGLCAQVVGVGLVGRQLWFQSRKCIRGSTAGPPAYGVHDDALYKSTFFTFTFSDDNSNNNNKNDNKRVFVVRQYTEMSSTTVHRIKRAIKQCNLKRNEWG